MGKLDYRVKYEYPLRPGETKPNKGTIMKGEESGADVAAQEIALRGATAEVWHVHHETGARTHLHTYSPAGVPDEQFDDHGNQNGLLTDEEVAQRQVAAPAPVVAPGTEHLKTGEVYSYTEKTGATPEPTVEEAEPVKKAPTIDDVSEALRHLGIRSVTIQLSDGEPRFVLPMSDMVKVLGHIPKELW